VGIEQVLGPTNNPLTGPNTTAEGVGKNGKEESKPEAKLGMPTSIDAIPAWSMGMAIGTAIAEEWLESDPSLKGALESKKIDEDSFKEFMQAMMSEVMKSMKDSTKYLEETDDGEESVKGLMMQ